ncbi:MAG: dimethylamine monooxygenase subunit DmmA family protein [Gammaproteobacteria bacterium]
MLVSGIKSKPVYAALAADHGGKSHLLVAQGSGGEALLRLLDQMQQNSSPSGMGRYPQEKTHTRILYATESVSGKNYAGKLKGAGTGEVKIYSTIGELLAELPRLISECTMGTRLYVAGSESFMGSVTKVATQFDLNKDEIQSEECGTLARRIYCIHCKTFSETVKTNIVECAGCQRWLLVRDHYSKRLAAYMGVMADAEAPGQRPPMEEIFR